VPLVIDLEGGVADFGYADFDHGYADLASLTSTSLRYAQSASLSQRREVHRNPQSTGLQKEPDQSHSPGIVVLSD